MAEETDLSRTEPASSRRLQQARSVGDVPRSAELSAWVTLLAALAMLAWLAPRLLRALQALTEAAFAHATQPLSPVFLDAAWNAVWAVLPVLGVIVAAAVIAPLLLSGWVFAPQRTHADVARADPFKPLARLFSVDSLFDGSLALLKLAIAAAAVGWVLASGWPDLPGTGASEMSAALDRTSAWVGHGVLVLAAVLALAAAIDAGWRWWRYLRRHAMTWQEVMAEAREAEVHPEVRAQLRGRQQRAGQGALPNSVPQTGEAVNRAPASIDEVIE